MHQVPVRLELDNAIVETTRGADVIYTVTLKNGANRPTPAQADVKIDVVSPFGMPFPVVISQGQPSTTFRIKADQAGVLRLHLKAAGLTGTSSLIVVKPPAQQQGRDQSKVRPPDLGPAYTMKVPKTPPPVAKKKAEAPYAAMKVPKVSPPPAPPPSVMAPATEMALPTPPPTGAAAAPAMAMSAEATAANHLEIFLVDKDPVAQDPTDHRWRARLYVAPFTPTATMADVVQDLPIHLQSAASRLDRPEMTITHGQQPPLVVATAEAPGPEQILAFATGMPVAAKTFLHSSPSENQTQCRPTQNPV
jgi:hypothetical protein